MRSERGLVERVKKLVPEQEPWVEDTARAIIEEVADWLDHREWKIRSLEGAIAAIRAQAQESEE